MKSATKSPCYNTARDLVFSTCPSSIFYSVDIITTQKITFQWTCQEISNKLIRQHKPITLIFCVFSSRAHARMQCWPRWLFLLTAQKGCRLWVGMLLEGGGKASLLCWSHHKYCWCQRRCSTKTPLFFNFFKFFFTKVYTNPYAKLNQFRNFEKHHKMPNVKTSSTSAGLQV